MEELQRMLQQLHDSGLPLKPKPLWLKNNYILQGIGLTGLNIVKGCAAVGDAQSKLHNMYQVIGADTLQTLLPDPVGL
ncbi:hypothetical protein TI03_06620, partial [Achromatium sp. WMS1]